MNTITAMWLDRFLNTIPDLTLLVPDVPPSVNHYMVRTRHNHYPSAASERFKTLTAVAFHEHQRTNPRWYCTPAVVGVSIRFRIGVDTTMDVDNHPKVLLDALTGLVWDDDSQVKAMFVIKELVRPAPRQRVRDIKQTEINIFLA